MATFITWLLSLFKSKITNPAPNIIPEEPQPIIPTPAKYDWDAPILARHSVRVICDEEGLDLEQKNTMCATVGAESGWETNITHANYIFKGTQKNLASTDFGICMWNDYYHGKEITPDEALHNPEKAVRLMCAYWKRGQRDLWIAYRNGSYKRFL